MSQKALILIDVQKDFCPGGRYPVPYGDEVVSSLNEMLEFAKKNHWVIVASRDWHPKETEKMKDWTAHCVENTDGAKFHPDLQIDDSVTIISKGEDLSDKHFSAFNGDNILLADFLSAKSVKEVYIGGLATDYCVKNTALDAVKAGFKTTVILDACRGIFKRKTKEEVLKELKQAGVNINKTNKLIF